MAEWFWFGVAAAVLYGLHQVFTKLAAPHIDSATGALVVEGVAALSILAYIAYLKAGGRLVVEGSKAGAIYSILTGICVGTGTILFFVLFQKGGPLSAVPVILAGGAAIMAVVGMTALHEPFSWQRLAGVAMALAAMYLLNSAPKS